MALSRRPVRLWHRWIGWTLGAVFAFQGLTGAAIVYKDELDRALHPALFGPMTPGAAQPAAVLVAEVQAAYSGKGQVTGLLFPAHPGEPATARVTLPDGRHAEAAVDPVTARVFGPRIWEGSLIGTIYDLHNLYVFRSVGYRGVGIIGLMILISLVAGVRLAWPGRGGWRRAIAPPPAYSSPQRAMRDQHARLGLLAAPLLAVSVATGVWMSLGDLARPGLATLGAVDLRLDHPAQAVAPLRISAAAALAAARQVRQGESLTEIDLPGDEGSYRISFVPPGPADPSQTDLVDIDGSTGRVLSVIEARRLPWPERLWRRWLYPLHNGQALGPLHRIVVLVLGLAPAILFGLAITGTVIRSRRRTRRPARHPDTPTRRRV